MLLCVRKTDEGPGAMVATVPDATVGGGQTLALV
jgi:hypothetical protein